MDIISQVVLFIIIFVYIQSRKKELNKDKMMQQGKGGTEFGYFLFGEDSGINQSDEDPFLSDEYDNGPGWDDSGEWQDGDWG